MKVFVSILLFFAAGSTLAQSIIQGHVLDGETNTPLPGATVFIANSTWGVASGRQGEFMIKGLPRAHYNLVISFIGYETQVLDVVPNAGLTFRIIMKPADKQLHEVVVTSKKRSHSDWLANFRLFKEKFIGLSENARFCNFENASLLHFSNRKGILEAWADSTLVLENRGLGYRIKIVLEKYKFSQVTATVHYEGQMVYEPIVPENDEEKVHWARARLKAYYGSEMHFLRSLYARNVFDNGFYFNVIRDSVIKTKTGGRIVRMGVADTVVNPKSPIFNDKRVEIKTMRNYRKILDSTSTAEEPVLSFNGDLEIQYINEAESGAYQNNRRIFPTKIQQRSTVILHSRCIIQPHGQVYPQDAVETKNYWSWELMAESLPLDYDPNIDLAIVSGDE